MFKGLFKYQNFQQIGLNQHKQYKSLSYSKSLFNFSSKSNDYYSFCIIGAGPAGFMAAKQILKKYDNSCVHLFEKQYYPFGLIRYGVAPDHLPIKNVTKDLTEIAENYGEDLKYFGNIEIGKDIQIKEIQDFYSGIIYAYGADTDRMLNIKGENDSIYVQGAKNIVSWYNKHPNFHLEDNNINLKGVKNVAIVGNGNVAIDIARIFLEDRDLLEKTEISEKAMKELEKSEIQNVFVIGRRGIVQSAFSLKELRDLTKLKNIKVHVYQEDLENINKESMKEAIPNNVNFDPRQRANQRKLKFLQSEKVNVIQNSEQLDKILNNSDKSVKNIILRYHRAPNEVLIDESNSTVKGVKLNSVKLSGEAFKQKAEIIKEQEEILDVQMVVRSIGYKSEQINDQLGWDQGQQVIQNSNGCVLDKNGQIVKGSYLVGWIKTGPIGVLDTTYVSSIETCNNISNHISQGILDSKDDPYDEIVDLIQDKGLQVFNFDDWKLVDQFELQQGEKTGKIRSKVDNQEQVKQILYEAYPFTCQK